MSLRMSEHVRYLTNGKRGGFVYRRGIPADIRPALGGAHEWKHALGRVSFSEAIKHRDRLARDHDALIASIRAGKPPPASAARAVERLAVALINAGDVDEAVAQARDHAVADHLNSGAASARGARLDPLTEAVLDTARDGGVFKPRPTRTRILSALYEEDRERQTRRRAQQGRRERDERPFKAAVDSWLRHVGDTDFIEIDRALVERWVEACRDEGVSDVTIDRRINSLQGIQSRKRTQLGLARSSVWSNLDLDFGAAAVKRLPFHSWHLDLIDRYLKSSKQLSRHNARMVRLMRTLSLGPSEVAGVLPNEVDLSGPIPTVMIRDNHIRGLKTADRPRALPLVGDGLAAVKEALADPGKVALFLDTKFDRNTISANLNHLVRRAGVPNSPRLTIYSMRSTFKTAIRQIGIDDYLLKYAMGHAQSRIEDAYNPPLPELTQLQTKMLAALPHWGCVNSAAYTAEELPPERRR